MQKNIANQLTIASVIMEHVERDKKIESTFVRCIGYIHVFPFYLEGSFTFVHCISAPLGLAIHLVGLLLTWYQARVHSFSASPSAICQPRRPPRPRRPLALSHMVPSCAACTGSPRRPVCRLPVRPHAVLPTLEACAAPVRGLNALPVGVGRSRGPEPPARAASHPPLTRHLLCPPTLCFPCSALLPSLSRETCFAHPFSPQ